MCGIAALLGFGSVGNATDVVGGMVERLSHRGPDWRRATRVHPEIVLGHARLSIVDLSDAGAQPMSNEDGRVWVVCNGEVYNHRELRATLAARGHLFSSSSDSEVLVHLWEEYGVEMLQYVHGMFAFVLADCRTGDVLVARDRLGKKPIVFAETAQGVALASELPALRGVPGIDWQVDADAAALYLLRNLRHIPDPWTLYRGVRRLPPAHAMLVRAGRITRTWCYWSPDLSQAELSGEELLALFDAAVGTRMVADVEVGALLSGGVDSTAIIDAMRRQGADRIRTYALGRDRDDEELARARAMAQRYDTQHTEVHFDPDRHHDHLELLLRRHGEPIMLLPLGHAYDLFQHVHADGIRVVMTGHGADEVFYGYDGHRRGAMLSNALRWMPPSVRAGSRWLARHLRQGTPLREALTVAGAAPGARKAALYRDEAAGPLSALMPHLRERETVASIDRWLATWRSAMGPAPAFVDEAALIGLMQENAHSVTIAGDLPAMATGVEVRCPFLDATLVSAGLRVPYTAKVGHAMKPRLNKQILKTALEARLPREVLYAPKRGFGYHIQERDILLGPWRARVDAAFSRTDLLGGAVAMPEVRRQWSAFLQGAPVSAQVLAKLYAACVSEDQQMSARI
jgi:asparagine synthase (glutamine-hydrolysing)